MKESASKNLMKPNTDECLVAFGSHTAYDGKQETREGEMMSFAGISAVDGRIFAFSDTKGSIYDGTIHKYVEDSHRGSIKKIFYNQHFVAVTTGVNSFWGHGDRTYYVSDWIDEHILSVTNPYMLLQSLFGWLKKNSFTLDHNEAITFLFLYRSEGVLYQIFANIKEDGIEIRTTEISVKSLYEAYIGNPKYVHVFEQIPGIFKTADPDAIRDRIQTAVKLFDTGTDYNFVGGDIQVIEYHFDN